jgi:hypothetical protein
MFSNRGKCFSLQRLFAHFLHWADQRISLAAPPAFWTLQPYLEESEAKSCRSKQAVR